MPKKITLENLAQMVATGFSELELRLVSRIDQLDISLEQVKTRLDNMAPRFELKQLEKRIDKIEKRIGL